MQIERRERGMWRFAGVTKSIEEKPARLCKDESVVEVSLPEEKKMMSGRNEDRLGGGAAKARRDSDSRRACWSHSWASNLTGAGRQS